MTRRLPLFEFMPYGAPELLEEGRPGMARALALGSLAWLVLFASLMSLGPWNPVTVAVHIPSAAPQHEFLVPPSIEHQIQAITPVVPTTPPDRGIIVPVDQPLQKAPVLPPVEPNPSTGTMNGGATTTGPTDGTYDGGTVHEVGPPVREEVGVLELDRSLDLISAPKPVYSDFARDAGIEGDVRLRLLVGIDGRVEEVVVIRSVPLLDESAVAAVRRWVFVSPTYNGKPVRVRVDVPVRFRLHTN